MTNKTSLTAFNQYSDDLEHKYLNGVIEPLSADELRSLGLASADVVKLRSIYSRNLIIGLCVGTGAAIAALVNASIFAVPLCVAVLLGKILGFRTLERAFAKALETRDSLAPLRDPELCSEALRMAKSFAICESYRQLVLAQNREFVKLDLVYMDLLAEYSLKAKIAEEAKAVCKMLYDIPA